MRATRAHANPQRALEDEKMHTDRLVGPIAGSLNALLEASPAAFACLARWLERARERHALAALDERLLRDIGYDRAEVTREVAKPFWQA